MAIQYYSRFNQFNYQNIVLEDSDDSTIKL